MILRDYLVAVACTISVGFVTGSSLAQQGSIADPDRTTLTPGVQHWLPPPQDSRSPQARAHLEKELSGFMQKVDGLGLSPACSRVLRNAVKDGAHFLIFTSDNDGTDSVLLYAAMACPPAAFGKFWEQQYASFRNDLISAYFPTR